MKARFIEINPDKKIQAIKTLRSLSGIGLREAKNYCDDMGAYGDQPGEWFNVVEGMNRETIIQECLNGYIAVEIKDHDGPLPIHLLALKLSLHGFTSDQVKSLADALEGIEDAEGSLRECVRMMESVR
jgi:ribosomal protein S13